MNDMSLDDKWMLELAKQSGWTINDIQWKQFEAIIDSETDKISLIKLSHKFQKLIVRIDERIMVKGGYNE